MQLQGAPLQYDRSSGHGDAAPRKAVRELQNGPDSKYRRHSPFQDGRRHHETARSGCYKQNRLHRDGRRSSTGKEKGPIRDESGLSLLDQLVEPGARTSMIRFRSSTLANSMLTLPFLTPREILTFVSRRSESDDAR